MLAQSRARQTDRGLALFYEAGVTRQSEGAGLDASGVSPIGVPCSESNIVAFAIAGLFCGENVGEDLPVVSSDCSFGTVGSAVFEKRANRIVDSGFKI